jgi:NAD+-dependent secondary alcohol dehydrogenase Adh1
MRVAADRHPNTAEEEECEAARLHGYHERLKLDSIEEPTVTGRSTSSCDRRRRAVPTDLHIIEGQWAEKSGVTLPYTLGHENAGWVHEVGSAVSNVAVGDAVIVHPLITCGLCAACRAGDDMHCETGAFPGIDTDGGFAELLQTNARAVVKLDPPSQPPDVAAHADAGLTAYHAVKKASRHPRAGDARRGHRAGGLGHIGIQCLKALTAAEIIVVDPLEPALELARSSAPTRPSRSATATSTRARADRRQGRRGVVDFVGEKGATADGVAMLRDGGSYYVIGYGENVDIPTIDIISREITSSATSSAPTTTSPS